MSHLIAKKFFFVECIPYLDMVVTLSGSMLIEDEKFCNREEKFRPKVEALEKKLVKVHK